MNNKEIDQYWGATPPMNSTNKLFEKKKAALKTRNL